MGGWVGGWVGGGLRHSVERVKIGFIFLLGGGEAHEI